jgi:DNA helicase-2/ATP-dependent DNA helicase PcrA
MGLSTKQQEIVDASGKVVVKACPGSGKTYSVAARIADKLKKEKNYHKGIAAISFTNTAWREINDKLTSDFNISTPLPYPHFVGTLDSFFNHYVFLPYAQLILNTSCRPNLVGEPHYPWGGRYYLDSFFDKISLDIKGAFFDKKGSRIPLKDKSGKRNVYTEKQKLLDKGLCTQSDANYYTLQILKKYPLIAENIAIRFPIFIIDEAQDTNDIQMDIINQLVANGLKEVMLVGDPNQAIFEWNNANPKLFKDKYDEWTKIKLDENRRSSKNICDCSNAFIGESISMPLEGGDVIHFPYIPEIVEVDYDTQNVKEEIIQPFLNLCRDNNIEITNEKVAVLYRSKSFQKYFEDKKVDYMNLPWKAGAFYLRDIVQGKYLMEQGDLKQGFKLIEQGFFKAKNNIIHVKREQIQAAIDKIGYVKYRTEFFKIIDNLPSCDRKLKEWLSEVNDLFGEHCITVDIKKNKCNVSISQLFDLNKTSKLPYYQGTIHSAKGCTFEAVLLLLSKNAGNSNCSTLLKTDYKKLSVGQKEEVRNIYVAITRPRKILQLGVPKKDVALWKKKLQIKAMALAD